MPGRISDEMSPVEPFFKEVFPRGHGDLGV